MFERFTSAARAVIADARQRAVDEDAAEIREEHLLAALLAVPKVAYPLERLGVAGGAHPPVLQEIAHARRQGGLSPLDAQALAGLGIELDAVVSRIEAELGISALDTSRRRGRRRSRLRLSPQSALALQAGLQQATERGDRELREEHLLLGLMTRPGTVADALAARGATPATLLAALHDGSAPGRAG